MHDMPTHRMSQMVVETIGQGTPQVTAEVGAEAASSQKQEVTVPTPSQGKSQPMTISNNQTDFLTMSGKSSSPPASEVQHLKPSCVKTASPKIVSQLQSEEATHVYRKTFPQHTSQSGDDATMHDMPTHRMSQMVAETIGQGSPQVTAEVGAEAASSQKQEVTVPTPSQGKSQPMHAKPAPDASPGDNPSPQVRGQSSAQATTADKRHEDATSALPSHSRNLAALPVETQASRCRRSMQRPSQLQTQLWMANPS